MSSAHYIIVARHDKTGELKLPLGDMTLYGVGGEEELLKNVCDTFGEDWTLALYAPVGAFYGGAKNRKSEPTKLGPDLDNRW